MSTFYRGLKKKNQNRYNMVKICRKTIEKQITEKRLQVVFCHQYYIYNIQRTQTV